MAGAEWRVAAVAVVVVDPAEFVLFCARRDARPKLPYHMTHVSVVRPSLFEYPPSYWKVGKQQVLLNSHGDISESLNFDICYHVTIYAPIT